MKTYLEANKERFLEELFELLRIPSVSTDPSYAADLHKAADYVKVKLEEAGVDKAEICQTAGYPIVYAEKMYAPDAPTVLVYGHYDVQPADPLELWTTPPFEPEIRDGKIYARGACDDKGQFYMHIKALEMMNKTGNFSQCNMKFMFEGEEESGSEHLETFVMANVEKLKADVILISDTGMIANDIPSITTGVRGLSYLEVEVMGPNRDLHSGLYGGAVPNPINVLAKMIASLIDDEGRITIPKFYDNVALVSDAERAEMAKAPFDLEGYKKSIDISDIEGEKGYSTKERQSIRPTLDVNGIWGGYIEKGAKTVIPSKAFAKISMRLVPNQSSDEITNLFKNHFEAIAPKSVKVHVTPHHGGEAAVTAIDSIAYQAANDAYQATFGKKPVPERSGGSIPIVGMFKERLGIDTIMMGFGLSSDAIHSPNEHYGVFNYFKGIETIPHFYKNYAKMWKNK